MLMMSAVQNFETSKPITKLSTKQFPKFSPEHLEAYNDHESTCKAWRMAGRPMDKENPAEKLKPQQTENCKRVRIK